MGSFKGGLALVAAGVIQGWPFYPGQFLRAGIDRIHLEDLLPVCCVRCTVQVCVMRPDGKGGQVEAVVLGRGQFVGERAVINNKLRSADCVARGSVQVVVMKKRDFMDLDNPLLTWMMDYDAVSTCLRVSGQGASGW